MKIYTKKQKRFLPLIIGGAAVVLLILASTVYVYALGGNLFGWKASQEAQDTVTEEDLQQVINESPATEEEIETGKQIKEDSVTTDEDDDSEAVSNVSVIISSIQQSDQELKITALVQTVTNSGTCTLNLSKGSTSITKEVGVQALSSTSTCRGFTLNRDDEGITDGDWSIKVTFQNASKKGAASVVQNIE